MRATIGCLGAGRMGRGIAVVFAFAGHEVVLIDFKRRETSAFEAVAVEAKAEIRSTLEISLASISSRSNLFARSQTGSRSSPSRTQLPLCRAAMSCSRDCRRFSH